MCDKAQDRKLIVHVRRKYSFSSAAFGLFAATAVGFALTSPARSQAAEPWCRKWVDNCVLCAKAKDGSTTCRASDIPCTPGHHCVEVDPAAYGKNCRPHTIFIHCNRCNGLTCTQKACPIYFTCEPI